MPGRVPKKSAKGQEKKTDPTSYSWDPKNLISLANQNKSKKCKFSFSQMIKSMQPDEIDKMWDDLSEIIINKFESAVMKNNPDTSKITENGADTTEVEEGNKSRKSTSKHSKNNDSDQKLKEVGCLIRASIEISHVIFANELPVSPGLLNLVIFLNGIIFQLPNVLENLTNGIISVCEKMFCMNYVESQSELFTYNALTYLLIRSSSLKASKRDVKRVYALRSLLPKIITLDAVDSDLIWEVLKKCVVSKIYLSVTEGQKIITLALIMDIDHTKEIHEEIKEYLRSCNTNDAIVYGKAYYEAWSFAAKEKLEDLQKEIEMVCIQDYILLGIQEKYRTIVENIRKVMGQFHCKKKEAHVEKMLYHIYQPILWRYLKSHEGLHRNNSAALFLDVFPLENPDADLVTSDLDLNDQLLQIKDLLLDECPAVRIIAIVGLCLAMSTQWELFPTDMIHTFLKILVEELSYDSSTAEVRSSVAKGFKGLLENPLSLPTLQIYLPQLKHLVHDTCYSVRVAFCQLLMSIKTLLKIKYFEVVPLGDLLDHVVEDDVISKVIVNLIHNSFFPKNEPPYSWLCRCVDLINQNRIGYRQFFQYIPRYVGVNNAAKFMIQTIKTIHFYLRTKSSSEKSRLSMNKSNELSESKFNDTITCEILEEKGFQDIELIRCLFDSTAILWFSCNLAKEENKTELKMVVKCLAKYMEELVDHYKDSSIWTSVFYLASFIPPEHVPSLAGLCLEKLKTYDESRKFEDYHALLQCLCNQEQGEELLKILKEWIKIELSQNKKKPASKRRKTGEVPDSTKSLLGVQLLNDLLDKNPCQKIIFSQHSKQLKSFLDFLDDLKEHIESLLGMKDMHNSDFVTGLMCALMNIAVMLHEEDNFNAVKYMENIVIWVQDKLIKPIWGNNSINVSRRSSLTSNKEISKPCKELVINITGNLCTVLADMTYLGFFNTKKFKFMKFGIQLLSFDTGTNGYILLCVSKLLLKHIWSAIQLYKSHQETGALEITPDCFAQIAKCLKNEDFKNSLPNNVLKEIQLILTESVNYLNKYNNPDFRLSYEEHESILPLCN